MTNKELIQDWLFNSAGKTRNRIPKEIVLRWLDKKDAEIARLREALQEISESNEDTPVLTYQRMKKIADDALSNVQDGRRMPPKETHE